MSQLVHNNHFVPQFYLKQWSNDGVHIWSYRTLVSNVNVPEWINLAISGVAYQRDLYTTQKNGEDTDDFEKWIEAEFENPVQDSFKKAIRNNSKLSVTDWERLAMFLGAQDLRTPSNYIESSERSRKFLPKVLESSLEKTVRHLEEKIKRGEKIQPIEADQSFFKNTIQIQTVLKENSDSNNGFIRAEVSVDREFWLDGQKFLLTKTVNTLKKHKWSIVHPAKGFQWFTSDHPVVKLNYYGNRNYDLKGGWGMKGGNIFMPISPRHLLFTQVGEEFPDRFTFKVAETRLIQSLIAERASRMIFSLNQMKIINKLRPRIIDSEIFNLEREQRKNWSLANKR